MKTLTGQVIFTMKRNEILCSTAKRVPHSPIKEVNRYSLGHMDGQWISSAPGKIHKSELVGAMPCFCELELTRVLQVNLAPYHNYIVEPFEIKQLPIFSGRLLHQNFLFGKRDGQPEFFLNVLEDRIITYFPAQTGNKPLAYMVLIEDDMFAIHLPYTSDLPDLFIQAKIDFLEQGLINLFSSKTLTYVLARCPIF